jgi:carboxymethylenebutenolidase
MSTEPDLGALLDEHVAREFVVEDVEATMQTMVAEPYVWHVPSMAGGAGHEDVREFYATQFIGRMPGDIGIHPVSRTIASGRVIEEIVVEFTHDVEMPWILAGLAPTGRKVRVPFVVVMGFEGDSIAFERIYWDQASVLSQIGLLDSSRLPVSGVEQAERLLELVRRGGTHES